MNIPLVSEYKLPFIRHRLGQTFFGGFELFPFGGDADSLPHWLPYALAKVATFCLPSAVGIVFASLVDDQVMSPYIGVLASSGSGFLLTMSTYILCAIQIEPNKTTPLAVATPPPPPGQQLMAAGEKTTRRVTLFDQLLPGHGASHYRVLHCLLLAILLGMCVHLYRFKTIHTVLSPNSLPLSTLIFVLVWFSHTVAQHSLVSGPLPETAAYSMTFNRLDCLNRPGHLLCVFLVQIIFPSSTHVYLVGTMIMASLPFLWLLGLVPPLSALVHYLLEMVNIHLLGGTPSTSMISLLFTVMFTLTSISLCQLYLTRADLYLMSLALLAYVVSNKWLGNIGHLRHYLSIFFRLVVVASIVALYHTPIQQYQHQLLSVVITLTSFIAVIRYSQHIYLFGILRNPLVTREEGLPKQSFNKLFLLFHTFFRVILHIVLPLLLTGTFKGLLLEDVRIGVANVSVSTVVKNILTFRLYRQTWQTPHWVAVQTLIISLIVTALPHPPACWTHLEIERKYLVLHFVATVLEDFAKKLYLVVIILFSSVLLPKQRLGCSWFLFVLNIVLFPFNLVIILVSSLLNAPILSLFTLPIFLPSFPRPFKFWSTTPMSMVTNDNHHDAVYYEQMLPHLIDSLHSRKLFWDFCSPGDFCLARFEDRLAWIQILERGHNYVQMQMKGLELQETSCHTIEASIIDHIISSAIDVHSNTLTPWFNTNLLYAITPLVSVPVLAYSDAKNVLTGIIDSPQTYTRIQSLYCKVFIWSLLSHQIFLNKKSRLGQRPPPPTNNQKLNPSSGQKVYVNIEPSTTEYGCLTYDQLQPDNMWSNGCYQYSQKRAMMQIVNYHIYTFECFDAMLNVLTGGTSSSTSTVSESQPTPLGNSERQSLCITYRHITNICFFILFSNDFGAEMSSAQSIYQLFNGVINDDEAERELFTTNKDLFRVAIRSFQYATKLAFDQIIYGNENPADHELIVALQEFDNCWHFGNRDTTEWKQAVANETKYLFTIGKETVKEVYTSRLLTLQEMPVRVCKLNRSIIESIWATLALELFYLTNDDEERYSIQAHPIILRNLTVQAADSPLGYPLFASATQLINHLGIL